MLVATPGGKTLADLRVADAQAGPSGRTSAWPTSAATSASNRGTPSVGPMGRATALDVAEDRPVATIHRADGSIVYGQVLKYDPASKEFVLRNGSAKKAGKRTRRRRSKGGRARRG